MLEMEMHPNLIRLLLESTNLTLAVTHETGPYCANCFFVFNCETKGIILKSDMNSKHMQMALKDDRVAGTILPDLLETNRIRGIQFKGRISLGAGNKPEWGNVFE